MYPKAYISYLFHFHNDQDYFECHEILEEYWKETDKGNKSSIWVGLILLAVSCYHHRRNNYVGALKTMRKAWEILRLRQEECVYLGLNARELLQLLEKRITEIEQHRAFTCFIIPIQDQQLMEQCFQNQPIAKINMQQDEHIINRHILRDRSSVIQNREKAIENRRK